MKKLSFISCGILLFLSCRIYPQNFDSLKLALKNAKHDTSRLAILYVLAESLPDGEWEAYNLKMRDLAEKCVSQGGTLETVYQKYFAAALNNLGFFYKSHGDPEKAFEFYTKSLKVHESIHNTFGIALACNNIGAVLDESGRVNEAIDYYRKSLKLRREIKDSLGIGQCLNNLGVIYKSQGSIKLALETYHEALKLQQKINDRDGIASTFTNIGVLYASLGSDSISLDYYFKSLAVFEQLRNQYAVAQCLNNIGTIYLNRRKFEKALDYYAKSKAISEKLGDDFGTAQCLSNAGSAYYGMGENEKAIGNFRNSSAIQEKINDRLGLVISELHLSKLFYEKTRFREAKNYAARSLNAANELGYPDNISNAAEMLYLINKKENNPAKALQMHELYIQMRDSVNNQETRRAGIKKQFQYEFEKKEAEVKTNARIEKEKLELKSGEDRKRQNVIIYSVLSGLLLVSIFSAFIFRSLQQNKKANKIIALQKREVEQQKRAIEEKQQEILDSIHYAKRIQTALITSEKNMEKMIGRLTGQPS